MRYWWVNQNQTFKHEVQGGFLWSPKKSKNGRRNPFYDTMTEVAAGDVVLSFCDTRIKAIGIAQGSAVSAAKPDFGRAGAEWNDEGWLVPVEFTFADNPVRPKDFIEDLKPHLAAKYAPLQANGNGNQTIYLTQVSEPFTETVLAKMGLSLAAIAAAQPDVSAPADADEQAMEAVQGRTDIGPTQKQQLVLSRRGQGIFKANVRLNEKCCRVTGVADPQLLIASHIKPWRDCSDEEKLDGCNGLLLSPHIDLLFDRGLLSFDDDGGVLRSPKVAPAVWAAWGLDTITNVGAFNGAQGRYLDHHRKEIFKA